MSFLKGFTSLFDWMFPQSYQEMSDDLDEKKQDLYDKNGWGKYKAYWWLYDREAGRFPDKYTIIVNGINITDTIRQLLKDRLFI